MRLLPPTYSTLLYSTAHDADADAANCVRSAREKELTFWILINLRSPPFLAAGVKNAFDWDEYQIYSPGNPDPFSRQA